jgi:hypothetical protein
MKADKEATKKKASEEKEKELLTAEVEKRFMGMTAEVKESLRGLLVVAEVDIRLSQMKAEDQTKAQTNVGNVAEEEKDVNTENHTSTASETMDGVYITSPIQHNNILRSHQIIFTATYQEGNCDYIEDKVSDENNSSWYEAIKLLTDTPPLNCIEQMIKPESRFTFVERRISIDSGEPFRHFLDMSIADDNKIAETYRCINQASCGEGSDFLNEERLTGDRPDMVVFNFADEMIPVAVQMWMSCLSKDQNLPIDSCVQIVCQR